MIGLAARPGTAVLPMWWISTTRLSPKTTRRRAASSSNALRQPGSGGTTANLFTPFLPCPSPRLLPLPEVQRTRTADPPPDVGRGVFDTHVTFHYHAR